MDSLTLTPELEKLLRDVNTGHVRPDPADPTIIQATYQRRPRTVTAEVSKAHHLGLIEFEGGEYQLTGLGVSALNVHVRRRIAGLVSASRAPRVVSR